MKGTFENKIIEDKNHDYLRQGEQVSLRSSLIAGSLSGLLARNITAPLDTLKIRLQLTPRIVGPNGVIMGDSYTLAGRIRSMIQREGIRAFWKGNIPGSIMYVIYGGVQFSSYSIFNAQLGKYTKNHEHFHSAAVGGLSGMTSSFCSYPFDVLRTRFIANKQIEFFQLTDGIRDIWRHEGLRGFYHGCTSAMVSISLGTSIVFGSYESIRIFCEEKIKNYEGSDTDIELRAYNILNGGASSISGALSKTITFPLDTIRRRIVIKDSMHISKFLDTDSGITHRPASGAALLKPATQDAVYKSVTNSLVKGKQTQSQWSFISLATQIIQTEGLASLYKGLSMALIKSVPSTAVSLWSYETIMKLINPH